MQPLSDRDLTDLACFIARLRDTTALADRRSAEALDLFRHGWARFVHGFAAAIKEAAQLDRETASNYNIFRLLRIEHDEARTHSRVLGDLLDPCGSHGQGHAFLKLFLDHCHNREDRPPLQVSDFAHQWSVEVERRIPTGRLDIVISCHAIDYLLAIENKIFASEQPDQLARYRDWMKSHRSPSGRPLLVFLTPAGRQPLTGRDSDCLCLSYNVDISGLLKLFLERHVKAPNLSFVLKHYLAVIDNLATENECGDLADEIESSNR